MTAKYLTREDITVFLDILQRRKVDPNAFEENDHLNRKIAQFHNETMDTVIAQFRQVVKEAGYVDETVEGGVCQ